MPTYKAIENVLNFLWGKGAKLEIHTNPTQRSMIVRIPNEYIRKKVLEKRLWYVGTAMFHVSPWSATQAPTTPELLSIPLWAHLKGVLLSLRSQEGLSLAAGLVGEPKETAERGVGPVDLCHRDLAVSSRDGRTHRLGQPAGMGGGVGRQRPGLRS